MKWYEHINLGCLLFRSLIGSAYMIHGLPKLSGGPERWAKVGKAMGNLGIDFFPEFWGLCAALAEFGGGILLLSGFMFRPACIFLMFTMFVATLQKYIQGSGAFLDWSYPAEMGAVLLAFFFIGPGKYTFNNLINKKL